MKTIVMITYYEPKEGLLSVFENLKRLGYKMEYYPLFRYAHDQHDKKQDYMEHFHTFLAKTKPDIVLWWAHCITADELKVIAEEHSYSKHIFYNWDDPHVWHSSYSEMAKKAKQFDLVFTSCKTSVKDYLALGSKDAMFLSSGFEPSIHKPSTADPSIAERYTCDVSMILTNAYSDPAVFPNQYVNRGELLDTIYADPSIKLFVYGPESLKKRWPNSYKGIISYENHSLAFSNSKINLCTHVTNAEGYINERCHLVTACGGGVLLVDPLPGMKDFYCPDTEVYFIDKHNVIPQIKTILSQPAVRAQRAIKAQKRALMCYTWKNWTAVFHQKVGEMFLDATFLSQTFGFLSVEGFIKPEDALEFWRAKGVNQAVVPYFFDVPKNFCPRTYCERNRLALPNPHAAWAHWVLCGSHEGLKSGRTLAAVKEPLTSETSSIPNSTLNSACVLPNMCVPDQLIEIYTLFKKMYTATDKKCMTDALEEISKFSQENPLIDLNLGLQLFFSTIDDTSVKTRR